MNNGIMAAGFYDKFWRDVSLQLVKNGVEIKCVVTDEGDFYKANPLFKNTTIISEKSFEKIEDIEALGQQDYEMALSEDLLKSLSWDESVFLSITDRLTFFPISVRSRKKIYNILLKYWLKILEQQKIKTIIFPRTPHMGPENVLLALAKKLNLRVLCLERTSINDRVLIQDKGFEYFVKEEKSQKNKQDLIKQIGVDLYNEIYSPNVWVDASKEINKAVISGKSHSRIDWKSKLKKLPFVFSFLFKNSENSQFFFSNRRNWQVLLISFIHNFKCKRMRNFYEKNCRQVDLKRKFIYFPLHFQVERSTLPLGGVFENQLLALDILTKSIPSDWVIYVKEHPRQFQYGDLRKKHFRDFDDYQTMLQYKNVRLVSITNDSEGLKEYSQAVATITGSSGWESLIINKPCIVFGYPWYLPCGSCYRVTSTNQCRSAIKEICSTSVEQVEIDVLSFIAHYKNKFIISSNDYGYAIKSKIAYKNLVKNMAEGLASRFKN